MDSYRLPPISTLPNLTTTELTAILDNLFEPSTPLHTLSIDLLRAHSFASYDDLISSIAVQLSELAESPSTSDTVWLESIIGAHPRLGEKKVESAQSRSEQAQLSSKEENGEDKLEEMNRYYESTFSGLKYVVFVNGRDRSTILDDMHHRVKRNNISLERMEAIKALSQIAADRAQKLEP